MIFKILYLKIVFAQQCGNTDFTEETGIVASPGSPGGKFLKNLLIKRLLDNDFAVFQNLSFNLIFILKKYQDYPPNSNCVYTISSEREGEITLQFNGMFF